MNYPTVFRPALPDWRGHSLPKIKCAICTKDVQPYGKTQKTCGSEECKRRYRNQRQTARRAKNMSNEKRFGGTISGEAGRGDVRASRTPLAVPPKEGATHA